MVSAMFSNVYVKEFQYSKIEQTVATDNLCKLCQLVFAVCGWESANQISVWLLVLTCKTLKAVQISFQINKFCQ